MLQFAKLVFWWNLLVRKGGSKFFRLFGLTWWTFHPIPQSLFMLLSISFKYKETGFNKIKLPFTDEHKQIYLEATISALLFPV